MRALVIEEKCIGCGNCVDLCPAVFKIDETTGKSEAFDPEACDFAVCCESASENCPVEAIVIEE
jgi:ferredoxin